MTFPIDFLDAIRVRVGLAETIGRRVRLERRGREHVGLCPFHNEKSPSFTVVEDKGFFHCFGCGAHGDVIGFVMRSESLAFPEAVARLAEAAGLPMPVTRPEDAQKARRQASLYEVVEQAAQWFQAQLAGAQGRAARDYLKNRAVLPDTAERFRLGYAPDARGTLKSALMAKGISEETLLEAGLLVQPEGGGASYDRLRGRVVFPIADARGRVVGFGGRILGEGEPKYLNSPETPLFRKGFLLYGLAQARLAAQREGRIVVVEGYMDVISLHQAGIANVVAPLGTALHERQLELLWRAAPEIAVCLDADTAGFSAAVRAYQRALPLLQPERHLSFVLGAGGKDPDEVVRTQGADAMRDRIAKAEPWFEIVWMMHVVGLTGSRRPEPGAIGPRERARLEADCQATAGQIGHPALRRHVERYFRDRLWTLLRPSSFGGRALRSPARGEGGPGLRPSFAQVRDEPSPSIPLGRGRDGSPAPREREMVRAVSARPDLLERIEDDFARFHPGDARLDALCAKILEVAAGVPDLDSPTLESHLRQHGFSDVLDRSLAARGWARSAVAWRDMSLDDAERLWRDMFARYLDGQLRDDLRAAVADCGNDPTRENLNVVTAMAQVRHGKSESERDIETDAARPGERK